MIEINLIPDVKQDLIGARKIRNLVVSGSIVAGLVFLGIVVLMAFYLFGVQTFRSTQADNAITEKSDKLKQVPDLGNMLTIQNQLTNISKLHDEKNINSRIFEILTTINPVKPNQVSFSLVRIDAENHNIHIDGQASNGFVAADVFKKTIQATTFNYENEGKSENDTLAKTASLSDLSYGEDSTGVRVIRFSIDFEYSDKLFATSSKNVVIVRPGRQNATDSFKHVPEGLFTSRADDSVGGSN
ncbi:MAG: hypothetical protein WAW80_00890 [Candidatus Saccharimonadales bacterium]